MRADGARYRREAFANIEIFNRLPNYLPLWGLFPVPERA
jgi:hypothetical protein